MSLQTSESGDAPSLDLACLQYTSSGLCTRFSGPYQPLMLLSHFTRPEYTVENGSVPWGEKCDGMELFNMKVSNEQELYDIFFINTNFICRFKILLRGKCI